MYQVSVGLCVPGVTEGKEKVHIHIGFNILSKKNRQPNVDFVT